MIWHVLDTGCQSCAANLMMLKHIVNWCLALMHCGLLDSDQVQSSHSGQQPLVCSVWLSDKFACLNLGCFWVKRLPLQHQLTFWICSFQNLCVLKLHALQGLWTFEANAELGVYLQILLQVITCFPLWCRLSEGGGFGPFI